VRARRIPRAQAANILRMLHQMVGDEHFFKVVRKVLKTYTYSTITTEQLLTAFDREVRYAALA